MTQNPSKSGPEHARGPAAEQSPEESAFEHSQTILASMLENFPGIVFWKDRNSVYLGCNRNFSTIAGFADPAEVPGKTDYDMPWIKEQAKEYRADDQKVMSGGKPLSGILEMIRCADGKIRWFSTNKVPLRDADGRVIGVLGAGNDITELKLTDEQLKLANTILRTQQETALEGILIVDEQRQIISYNRRFVDMWGIPEDVIVSHSDERAIKVINDRLEHPQKFAEKVAYLYDHPYERSFDEIKLRGNITFERYSAPMLGPDGKYYGRVWYFRDITEQKRAEEALKAEHDQLLSIFDSIDELIYVADPFTYEVLFANRWTRERFKRSIIGGKCYREFQDRASPCDFCTNAIILRDKGKPYYWEYHNPVLNKDFWIVDRIIRWPDGRDVRFEMAIDITERKQAISAIQDAKAKAELYLDLMSHDITNMNQALMGYLELIKAEPKQESGEKELAERSIEIINRSSRMISNVKKLTEIEAQSVPLKKVNLCEILSEVVSEYSEVPDSKATFNASICPSCHVIAGDMLKEVFENLIDNAIRHSAGPVVVDIAVGQVALEGQDYYQITISDNGPGIPDPLKKKIFMSAQEIRQKAERRGFGLYIVRTLVNYYHGKVWVENRVPDSYTKGSKFIVLLPCHL